MTFRSFFRITLIGGSLWACVNQYTSPDGPSGEPEVESTGTEPPSGTSHEPSEATRPPNEATRPPNEATRPPDEAKRTPTDASGTCDDRSCVSTSDCCKGYQCGFDPERSKVLRYCLPQ
jgi:hypothetical protein